MVYGIAFVPNERKSEQNKGPFDSFSFEVVGSIWFGFYSVFIHGWQCIKEAFHKKIFFVKSLRLDY